MNPKQYFDSVKRALQIELARSARGYLKSGLELFHEERARSYSCIEPAIGNLSIAVELMLKTFLVKNNPILAFKEPPLELMTLFTCPNAIPSKDFNWRQYDIVLRPSKNKTIGLGELTSIFYLFFPNHKQSLRPYFNFLSGCRNASVHYSLPSFQKYELERTAYLALRVFEILDKSKTFEAAGYSLTKKDNQFLSSYSEERTKRVSEKIEKARMKSSKLPPTHSWLGLDSSIWEAHVTSCPVCGSDGILGGYTNLEAEQVDESEVYSYLVFVADSFRCDECGLELDDSEELRLAGMDIAYDRPDSDMDRWVQDFEDIDYEYGL